MSIWSRDVLKTTYIFIWSRDLWGNYLYPDITIFLWFIDICTTACQEPIPPTSKCNIYLLPGQVYELKWSHIHNKKKCNPSREGNFSYMQILLLFLPNFFPKSISTAWMIFPFNICLKCLWSREKVISTIFWQFCFWVFSTDYSFSYPNLINSFSSREILL